MNVWRQAPLVRLILPFLAGIITAIYFPFQYHYSIHFLALLFTAFAAVVFIPRLSISFRRTWVTGLLINSTLFVSAYQMTIFKTEKFDTAHFSRFTSSSSFVLAKIKEPYIEKERSLKTVVEVLAVKQRNEWQSTCGKAMVYFKKEPHSIELNYGDEIILKADFKEVPLTQNPGEFNYKRFLAFHNIFQQAYINSDDWVFTGKNSGNPILRFSIHLRNSLLTVFTENHLKGDEFSVGAALLLGYCDKLDADIISAYASTGALHVLSVSGLHVAIVYVVFSWLLFFFDKIRHGHIIKAILLILMLWFYSALTGLSPSVLRAAAMFSFIIIAKAFNRHTNIYNTLAASAFLLLIIDPYLIMEVGFQLSYLAVIGIVYIQPKIYGWFEVNNWLLDQIWTITAVSIAAQIATFPLGLHYFHQFPNYFLLSNLIVIPVSTVIIYLGISVFAFSKIPLFAKYLAICFTWSVWLLNASVKLIEKWPYALLQGISISVFETWLLYGLIILFFYYFTKRKFNYLVYAFCVTMLVLCSQIVEQYQQYGQKRLIIYNIPKTSAIDFISAKSNVLLTDTAFAINESGLLFHVKHNWWDLGVNKTTIITDSIQTNDLYIKNSYMQFYDKRMAIAGDKNSCKNDPLNPIQLDYLIVSNNTKGHITDLLKQYHPGTIIFDSSNSEYRISKWKKECAALNQPFYSVEDSGAFVVDI